MKKPRWAAAIVMAAVLILTLGTSVFAFDDLPEGPDKDKIQALQDRGVLQGNGKSFMSDRKLTNAEGVHMIVKGMDLSLAAFLFIKEPLASDSFDNVPDDAWYSNSMVIAAVNGLELPRELDPKAAMTREAFAHHLFTALMLKGDYPFTKMFYAIADDDELDARYRHSIQMLLNGRIITLGDDGHFYPKQEITRHEAAVMLHDAIVFAESHALPIPDEGISVEETVTYTVEKVTEDVNRIILSWGEQPNAGYRVVIEQLVFHGDRTVEVHYRLMYPEPDMMYAEVITTPKATVYAAANYDEVVLVQAR